MSIASIVGNNMRATTRQRELTADEIQVWSSLQLLENLPDGGWSQLETDALTYQRTFEIAGDLFHRHLGLKVTPSLCAWIAYHSRGSRERAVLWCAIVFNVVSHMHQTDPTFKAAHEVASNPERWGEAGLMRQNRKIKLKDVAVAMNNQIPTDAQFDLVWAGTKLGNGQHELDLPRSWT